MVGGRGKLVLPIPQGYLSWLTVHNRNEERSTYLSFDDLMFFTMLKDPQHELKADERSIQKIGAYCSANELKATLHERGFRLTVQRQKILSIFQTLTQGNHLSAEELHTILQQKRERISLSTVYRTLNLMAKIGLIRELEFAEGHKHYELNQPSSHQHHH
jgi:Ferric uptake regulator family